MKANKFLLIFLLLNIIYSNKVMANEYMADIPQLLPMSPTASAFAMYADYPVSHYTGVPQIEIPLYEINVDGFKLPITLSYHASGIRVSQEASNVGLGWALNAGGIISRTVKCYDDFLENTPPGIAATHGYYNGPEVDNPHVSSFYTYTFHGNAQLRTALVVDSEPDIFYYSLPGGLSGKFLIDKSRGTVLFNKSHDIKIEANYNRIDNWHFTAITPDGTKYIFKKREMTYVYSKEGPLNSNVTAVYDDSEISYPGLPVKYVSGWFLTQIITNTNRKINFTYEVESYKTPTQESCVKFNYLSHSGNISCGPSPAHPEHSRSKTVHESFRLSEISWDNGKVKFPGSARSDLQGCYSNHSLPKKVDAMEVYDANENEIKRLHFNYNYFNSTYTGQYQHAFKRLKLTGIENDMDADINHVFSYFEGSMPAKNSKNTDYWGFNNGRNYGSKYYSYAYYAGNYYPGANKTSDLNYLQIGTLKSIKYPTGESSVFTYEENEYRALSGINNGITLDEGMKYFNLYNKYSVDDHPGLPSTASHTFTVTSTTKVSIRGDLENHNCGTPDPTFLYDNTPVFKLTKSGTSTSYLSLTVPTSLQSECEYYYSWRTISLNPGTYTIEMLCPPRDVWAYWIIEYESIQYPESSQKNKGAGLRIAQIKTGNKTRKFAYAGGETMIDPIVKYTTGYSCMVDQSLGSFIYLAQLSQPTTPLTTFKNGNIIGYSEVEESIGDARTVYSFHNEQEEQLYEESPFSLTGINYYNGLPIEVNYYNKKQKVKTIEYEYTETSSNTIYSFAFLPIENKIQIYNYRVSWLSKSRETHTTYSGNNKIYEYRRYAYNDNLQIKSKKLLTNDWEDQQVFYPSDFTDAVSIGMVNKHMRGIPVETIELKNDMVISGKKTEYKDTLGMYLPKTVYMLNTKQPLSQASYRTAYKPELYFDQYNIYGKPLQIRKAGTTIVYLWSHKSEYPIAEIRNASYIDVSRLLTDSFIHNLASKSAPSSNDMNTINALRASLPDAFITTYTYKPLVGVTSITDSRKFTTHYDYDDLGRLKETYFLEGTNKRVIEAYTYKYSN